MKRFFCTICQRVRRARHMPEDVENNKAIDQRLGTCSSHHPPRAREIKNKATAPAHARRAR